MKRVIALFLVICMLFSMAPVSAYAETSNKRILENKYVGGIEAKGSTVDTTSSKYNKTLDFINKLGIFDEKGQPIKSKMTVDGKEMTLKEVMALINKEGTDLSAIISVEGAQITLSDLKTVLQIEKELSDIKKALLNGEITEEQAKERIKNKDIEKMKMGDVSIESEKYIKSYKSVTPKVENIIVTPEIIDNGNHKYSINVKLNKPCSKDISFNYGTTYGNFLKKNDQDGSGVIKSKEEVITIKAGQTSNEIKDAIEVDVATMGDGTYYYYIEGGRYTWDRDDWDGKAIFYVQFNNLINATFNNGQKSVAIPAYVQGTATHYRDYNDSKNILSYWLNPDGRLTYNGNSTVEEHVFIDEKTIYSRLIRDNIVNKCTGGNLSLYSDVHDIDDVQVFSDFSFVNKEGHKDTGQRFVNVAELDTNNTDGKKKRVYLSLDECVTCNPNRVDYDHYVGLKGTLTLFATDRYIKHFLWWKTEKRNDPAIGKGAYIDFNHSGDYKQKMVLKDEKAPIVRSVYVGDVTKVYRVGDVVPIIVEFYEPVQSDKRVSETDENLSYIIANGEKIKLAHIAGINYNRRLVFPYTLKEEDVFSDNEDTLAAQIAVSEINNIYDLGNNEFTRDGQIRELDLIKVEPKKSQAFSGYTVKVNEDDSSTTKEDESFTATITVDIVQNKGDNIKRWILSEIVRNNKKYGKYKVDSLQARVKSRNGIESLDFEPDSIENPTKLSATFKLPYQTSFESETYEENVDLYMDEVLDGHMNRELLELEQPLKYKYKGAKLIEQKDITIESDNGSNEITFGDKVGPLKINYVNGEKSDYKWSDEFEWTSSNEALATINNKGEIVIPTNQTGDVMFTLEMKNDGEAHRFLKTYKLHINKNEKLVYSLSQEIYESPVNHELTIRWNNTFDIGDKVTLKNSDGSVVPIVDNIVIPRGQNEFNIDQDVLKSVTHLGDEYSYTLEIKPEEEVAGMIKEQLPLKAKIKLTSTPAKVKLNTPGDLYITDDISKIEVNYGVENSNKEDCDYEFKITKNEKTIFTDNIPKEDNTHKLEINKVLDLKDRYIVSIRAKNKADGILSNKSYVLTVYNANAMKIESNGETVTDEIVLDNQALIENKSSEEILAMDRKIFLSSKISINGEAYKWSSLADQVKWNASDSQVTKMYYEALGRYYELKGVQSPYAGLLLSGIEDGKSKLTATHELTNTMKSVNVKVNTLKNKLYLFQIMPKKRCTFIYYNSHNERVEVLSDDQGAIAIYEEKGIMSDVYIISEDKEYIATVYNDNLKTSEGNGAYEELYPLNIVQMRHIAKAKVVLNNSDGTPYKGNIILKGGVFKNKEYCKRALLNIVDGKQGQTVTVDDGILTVTLDPTQFYVESHDEILTAEDKLNFMFEISFDKEYRTEIVEINANTSNDYVVRSGENIINLTTILEEEKNSAYIQSNLVEFKNKYRETVKDDALYVGINKDQSAIELITRTIIPGAKSEDDRYNIKMLDENGFNEMKQEMTILNYPFLSDTVIDHRLIFNQDNAWFTTGERRKLKIQIYKNDVKKRELNIKPTLINLIDVISVTAADEVKALPVVISQSIMDSLSTKNVPTSKDTLTNIIMSTVKFGKDTGLVPVTGYIVPTQDPTIFELYIGVSVGSAGGGNIEIENGKNIQLKGPDFEVEDLHADYISTVKTLDEERKRNKKSKINGKSIQINDSNKLPIYDKASGVDFTFGGGGYYKGNIYFDFKDKDWDIDLIDANVKLNGGGEFSTVWNAMVGPVPVTAEIKAGGKINFDTTIRNKNNTLTYLMREDSMNDIMMELRLSLYARAFGGLGFDASLVTLKIGVYGQVDLEFAQRLLLRSYEEKQADRLLSGQQIGLKGETGIEFTAGFIGIEYSKVLASIGIGEQWNFNEWDEMHSYWDEEAKKLCYLTPKSRITKSSNTVVDPMMERNMFAAKASSTMGPMLSATTKIVEVANSVKTESREYLNRYKRTWNNDIPIVADVPTKLQTNAYTYANPKFTDDGHFMLYISDMDSKRVDDSKIVIGQKSGEGYTQGEVISTVIPGYSESNPDISGSEDFAVVAFTKQLNKLPTTEPNNNDIINLTNGTEIVASVYDGVKWNTERLTNNSCGDLMPSVATNGKDAIVAYRKILADDPTNVFSYSGNQIVYRLYSDGHWGDEQIAYNAEKKSKIGFIDVELLDDGTYSIVYTEEKDNHYSANILVKGNDKERIITLESSDEEIVNPRVTAIKFNDNVQRFVVGWYTDNDIKLETINADGGIYKNFVENVGSTLGVEVTSKFKFAKNATSPEDLVITWTAPVQEIIDEEVSEGEKLAVADKDAIYGVKILQEEGKYNVSPAIEIFDMDAYTLVDNYDVRVEGDEIKAMLLGTCYDKNSNTLSTNYGNHTIVYKDGIANMYLGSGKFTNDAVLKNITYNMKEVICDMDLPIQFDIQNMGVDNIEKVIMTLDEKDYVFENVIKPNQSEHLSLEYTIPHDIKDIPFTVKTIFKTGEEKIINKDTLYFVFPDVGISKTSILKEEKGKRLVAVNLYNASNVNLKSDMHKIILSFYDAAGNKIEGSSKEITTQDELDKINRGTYGMTQQFDIESMIDEGKEIPLNGINITAKAEIFEKYMDEGEEKYASLIEIDESNNTKRIIFDSLMTKNNNEKVTIQTEQIIDGGKTRVLVDVKNNSMVEQTSGNIIVVLYDEKGEKLEQQSFDSAKENNGFVRLKKEESKACVFSFDAIGVKNEVLYTNSILDSDNAKLGNMKIEGVELDFNPDNLIYNISLNRPTSLEIMAEAQNPNAIISVDSVKTTTSAITITTTSAITVKPEVGDSQIDITVTSQDKTVSKTYIIKTHIEEYTKDNADVEYVEINDEKINFIEGKNEYEIEVEKNDDMEINVKTKEEKAVVKYEETKEQNVLEFQVISEDGQTTKNYRIIIKVKEKEPEPSKGTSAIVEYVEINGEKINFIEGKNEYETEVAKEGEIEVNVKTKEKKAIVKYEGTTGAAIKVELEEGENVLEFQVISEDGQTKKNYRITIKVKEKESEPSKGTSAEVEYVEINGEKTNFTEGKNEYEIEVAKEGKIEVNIKTREEKAIVKYEGTTGAVIIVKVEEGQNVLEFQVISEDGQTTKNYRITIKVREKEKEPEPEPSRNSGGISHTKRTYFKTKNKEEIILGRSGIIDKNLFKELFREKDRELVFKGDFYSWLFSSNTRQQKISNRPIDLSVSIGSPYQKKISELIDKGNIIYLHFDYKGILPTEAKMTVNIGDEYKDKEMYLYYYNETSGNLEIYGLLKCDNKGRIKFNIEHCSDYILSEQLFSGDVFRKNINNIGYINGYSNGNFGAEDYITRGETAALLDRVLVNEYKSKSKLTDIDMWAKKSIMKLEGMGYIRGYSDGTFKPNNNITKAEFVHLIANIMNLDNVQSYKKVNLKDIGENWAEEDIKRCYRLNLVKGYKDEFRPKDYITRAEAVTIINKIIGRKIEIIGKENPFKDLSQEHWAYKQIISAIQ